MRKQVLVTQANFVKPGVSLSAWHMLAYVVYVIRKLPRLQHIWNLTKRCDHTATIDTNRTVVKLNWINNCIGTE